MEPRCVVSVILPRNNHVARGKLTYCLWPFQKYGKNEPAMKLLIPCVKRNCIWKTESVAIEIQKWRIFHLARFTYMCVHVHAYMNLTFTFRPLLYRKCNPGGIIRTCMSSGFFTKTYKKKTFNSFVITFSSKSIYT